MSIPHVRVAGSPGIVGFPVGGWAAIVLAVALGALTPNPELTGASVLVIPIFVYLLARRGEPPILLLVVMLQWLQVATRVFHADFVGVPVNALAEDVDAPVGQAIALGLAALITLALGLRFGSALKLVAAPRGRSLDPGSISPLRLFVVYLILMVGGEALIYVARSSPAWQQTLSALASLKWVALFGLAYVALGAKRGRGLLVLATGIEVLLGLGGYFSDFKTVFFVLFIAALSAGVKLTWRQVAAAAVPAAIALSLVVVWTGVKEKYRAYLNQGTNAQVVLVPWGDRMSSLAQRVSDMDGTDLVRAVEGTFYRVEYVDYFARVLAYVPAVRPHTDGELWLAAVRHIFVPRAFFPEKPVLPSDSELTMRFTGWYLGSSTQGTSISLGYVAESYIDFGKFGMWLPICLLGVLWGGMYRLFLASTKWPVFGYGFAMTGLLQATLYETAAVKQLGGTVSQFIVLSFVLRFCLPGVLRWLGQESGGVAVPWPAGFRSPP